MARLLENEERLRMELYLRGYDDGEIARKTGVKRAAICNWRRKRNLPVLHEKKGPPIGVKMEEALAEEECFRMRKFLGALIYFAKMAGDRKVDVGMFINEWKKLKLHKRS